MSRNRLYIPGTDGPVNHFVGNGLDSPAENLAAASWLCVAKQGPVSWSRQKQTPDLMHLNVPIITVCFFGGRPGDWATSTGSRNAVVGTHIEVPPAKNTSLWLWLPNPCAAVSDWSNGSPVRLRL